VFTKFVRRRKRRTIDVVGLSLTCEAAVHGGSKVHTEANGRREKGNKQRKKKKKTRHFA